MFPCRKTCSVSKEKLVSRPEEERSLFDLQCWAEVMQEKVGNHRGEEYREGRRKSFDDIISVFDHCGDDQAADGLERERERSDTSFLSRLYLKKDHDPHDRRVALKEALLHHSFVIEANNNHQTEKSAKQRYEKRSRENDLHCSFPTELNVSHPHRCRSRLEDLLEVNTSKARRQSGHRHSCEAHQLLDPRGVVLSREPLIRFVRRWPLGREANC